MSKVDREVLGATGANRQLSMSFILFSLKSTKKQKYGALGDFPFLNYHQKYGIGNNALIIVLSLTENTY